MSQPVYSAVDLYDIAKNQRRLLTLILFTYGLPMALFMFWMMWRVGISPGSDGGVLTEDSITTIFGLQMALILVGMFLGSVLLLLLLRALGASTFEKVVMIIALFTPMPLISLLILLMASSRATRALRTAGYRIGLLGVGRAALKQLKAVSQQGASPLPVSR